MHRRRKNHLYPIELVKKFLKHIGEADTAKKFVSKDATIECCSLLIPPDDIALTSTVRKDLKDFRASCSAYDLKIDGITEAGGDVAAFGHFDYSACPLGLPRSVYFSVWARVDVERASIVHSRWLDQIFRAEYLRE
jgi:hypothetical protein